MRSKIFLLILLFSVLKAHAQMGNEWINFSQSYFKIPVAKNGIYKLSYLDLQAAGFPVASDPTKIQLFHRGVEQAIYVDGEADGQFNPIDFIEFYGQKNDGTLDAELYTPSTKQPHKYYNLYSDTTCYFLTIGSSGGKRMTNFFEPNSTSISAETSHIDEKLQILNVDYSTGFTYGENVQSTSFDLGEGWTDNQITTNLSRDYTFTNVTLGVISSAAPLLEMVMVGRGDMPHAVEIYVGSSFRLLNTVNFSGFDSNMFSQAIDWTDLAPDGTLKVRVKVIGVGGNVDRISVSYLKLNYAQQTDAQGAVEKTFTLNKNPADKSYIEIKNVASNTRLFDITDPSSVGIIGSTQTATLNAVVPATSNSRKIFTTAVINVPSVKPVSFRQIIPSQHNYLIISHPILRTAAGGYSDPVKSYAAYRASDEGGKYDTLVVNTQQLYDQFSGGEPTPVAIFRFMKFMTASNTPRYLFIIGKGLEVNYQYYRYPSYYTVYKDFVPTAGMPASDMNYTAGLAGTSVEPAVPTGRITATNSGQVAAYLNKIKEMEAVPYDALWRKNILHLSGGIEAHEPEIFKIYMEDFEAIAEDHHLGGQVAAIAKNSTDVTFINIADEVNNGLDLVTFFGHSSASTLDFDIGYVTNPVLGYNNFKKYPMLLMNGCEAGAFFSPSFLFGEDWVLADKKGATGFIAHSYYGLQTNLKRYADTFYEVGYGDSTFIHTGVGDIQKEVAKRYIERSSTSPDNVTQVQQMVLLGDPAVKLFGAPKPDLEINSNNISIESFDGGTITAVTDSFAVKMIVRNFGVANKEIMRIEVKRTLNDGSILLYDSLYPTPKFMDTLSMTIRLGRENGFGNNTFTVTLDPDNIIGELRKDNNTASYGVVVPLNGTKNLYPQDFSIVHSNSVNLSFQTTDLLSGERSFMVELDTLNTFDSPFKKQFTVKGVVLAKQAVQLLTQDTLAYYWRTKLMDPLPGESNEWTGSSFTYINNGPEGWAQVHFPQYADNPTEGLVKNATQRKLNFENTVSAIDIINFGASSGKPRDSVSVKIGGAEYNLYTQAGGAVGCRNNTINLIAFNKKSTAPYYGIDFKWYEILYTYGGRRLICGRKPFVINSFAPGELSTGNNDDVIQYVDNVSEGDSVVLYSIGDAGYAAWPSAAKIKLGELGISVAQIDALLPGEPVVIFARKGLAPGSASVFRTGAPSPELARLDVNKTITGGYQSGEMKSNLIGPAQHWQSFIAKPSEIEATDVVYFDIHGIKLNGDDDLLFPQASNEIDLSSVSAETYPYLKIVFYANDDINLTAAQLNKWLVTYTPVPEGLLIYKGILSQEVVAEGEIWKTKYGFMNISDKSFADSLTVRFEVFNQPTRTANLELVKIKPPAPGDTTFFELSFNSTHMSGLNDVNVFVNPHIQSELYYDNNVIELREHLDVQPDMFNPVLDVTIDGRHTLNNDFVSSNPFIVIKVWDENSHSLKPTIDGIQIFLTYPCDTEDCPVTTIDLSSSVVKWYAATDTSDFRVEFRPTNLPDGKYTLRVEAADATGNESGAESYTINFVVKNETSVLISEPHPNPFAVDTYITITVSGNKLPETYELQIVDLSGKLIRMMGQEELPAIFIGTNTLTWNGRDSAGNVIVNGMYLFKLSLTMDGQQIEKRGKIVLSR
jgi:hypothetical protein